jgi:hypothetical protein
MRRSLLLPLLALVSWTGGCDASGGAPVGPGGEDEPFTVASRNPAPGARGISPSAYIEVGFNGVIDPASVDDGSLGISGGVGGTVTVDGTKLRLTPSAPLQLGTAYTVILAADVRGDDGDLLGATPTWGFKTAGIAPPPDTTGPDAPRPR